jgi:glycerol-1-phosphate dehydrogenase [NAD(P)+]
MKFSVVDIIVKNRIENLSTIKSIIIDYDIIEQDLSKNLGTSAIIISDETTHKILAKSLAAKLAQTLTVKEIILPNNVKPQETLIKSLNIEECDFVIGVGSGTINDICKYASYLAQKKYIIYGTAPSMNGYSSANASIITSEGLRTSKAAHLPEMILFDIEVLKNAPLRLIQSGLGDSLCRPTAQADWLLSHHLTNSHYDEQVFDLLLASEKLLFSNSAKLAEKDEDTIIALTENLILSGIGMSLAVSSSPASGGEHLIAHFIEMAFGNKSFHGEQIAVATLIMVRLQEKLLNQTKPPILTKKNTDTLYEFLPKELADSALAEYQKKEINLSLINQLLLENWQNIKEEIKAISIPSKKLEDILLKAGAPTRIADIGWNNKMIDAAINNAAFTRNRFTFLDLL